MAWDMQLDAEKECRKCIQLTVAVMCFIYFFSKTVL